MLSRNLEQTLHRALSLASERRHEYATLEHLLLGLTDDSDAATVLKACGLDLDKLRTDLGEFLDKDLAGLATDRPGDPKPIVSGPLRSRYLMNTSSRTIHLPSLRRCLNRSLVLGSSAW